MNGYFLCGVLVIFYYAVLVLGLKQCNPGFKRLRREKNFFVWLSLILIGAAAWQVFSESFIYYWDYGSYWYRAIWGIKSGYLNMKASELYEIIIRSINREDYNIAPSLLIMIPLKFFGSSYRAFILLNTVMFYIPNAVIMAEAMYLISWRCGLSKSSLRDMAAVILAFGFSGFLLPLLEGYVDVACCPLVAMAFLLTLSERGNEIDFKKDLLLSCCLLGFLLMRRYFTYAAIGGGAFIFLYWLTDKDKIKFRILDLLITILPVLAIMFFYFPELCHRYLFNNYAIAYSAYKYHVSFSQQWLSLSMYFGILFFDFMAAGIFIFINFKLTKLALCFAFSLGITAQIFFSTQDFGIHHYYVILFQACMLVYLGFAAALEKMRYKTLRKIFCGVFVLVILVNFCAHLGINALRGGGKISKTFSQLFTAAESPKRYSSNSSHR